MTGPITLFDKSFLQSLSVDESVWFDHFFLTNICPLFYVETLADLGKSGQDDRTPEQEVEQIADKFPQMHGMPSEYHIELCAGDLAGNSTPMTGQIPLSGGRVVKVGGRAAAVYDQSEEAQAFLRWQDGEFREIERRFAQAWRSELSAINLQEVQKAFQALGIDAKTCKTLEEAKILAEQIVANSAAHGIPMALSTLHIPTKYHADIQRIWAEANFPSIVDYAPYAAHVLTIEMFFRIALAANLISSGRPSNRIDVAYLFYLPFCMMFVSSDKLHRRTTPLFLRDDQLFVWGPELKTNLAEINSYFLQQPGGLTEKGLYSFTDEPPRVGNCLVSDLWQRLLPGLAKATGTKTARKPLESPPTVEEIKAWKEATPLSPEEMDFDPQDTSRFVLERKVRMKRGSWYQIPKSFKAPGDQPEQPD